MRLLLSTLLSHPTTVLLIDLLQCLVVWQSSNNVPRRLEEGRGVNQCFSFWFDELQKFQVKTRQDLTTWSGRWWPTSRGLWEGQRDWPVSGHTVLYSTRSFVDLTWLSILINLLHLQAHQHIWKDSDLTVNVVHVQYTRILGEWNVQPINSFSDKL